MELLLKKALGLAMPLQIFHFEICDGGNDQIFLDFCVVKELLSASVSKTLYQYNLDGKEDVISFDETIDVNVLVCSFIDNYNTWS